MHHGLAQVFGSGFAASMALHNGAGRAVILHHGGIGDGNIGGALLEFSHGITARGHHTVYERIGFADGHGGIVDKTALNQNPLLCKSIARSGRECLDREAVDALLAIDELHLGFGGVASLKDGAIILRTEMLLEVLASAFAVDSDERGGDCDHSNNDYYGDQRSLIHGSSPFCGCDAAWESGVVDWKIADCAWRKWEWICRGSCLRVLLPMR